MEQLTVPVVTGCLAILIGLAPVDGLMDGFVGEIERFRAAILGLPPRLPVRIINQDRSRRFKGQIWFAIAGAAFILVAVVNYVSSS